MKTLLPTIILFIGINLFATDTKTDTLSSASTNVEAPPSKGDVLYTIEKMPEFPGGVEALYQFLEKEVKYPDSAKEKGIQGRVVCQFVVNTDGSIVDIQVVRGVSPELDKESIRVISTMPKWKPGEADGKAVKVRYTMPIIFQITD